jgi:hypothetical protein
VEKESLEKVEEQLLELGTELNKLESVSKILEFCFFNEDLKISDIENLSSILAEKIFSTKQKYNDIENILKI